MAAGAGGAAAGAAGAGGDAVGGAAGAGGDALGGAGGVAGAGGGPLDCTTLPSKAECQMCCASENQAGYGKFETFLATDCGCMVAAPCASDCGGNACMGMAPSAACTACLNGVANAGTDACMATVQASCTADAECMAFGVCALTCP